MPTYGELSTKHPDYDAKYWRRIRALYAGGKKLLADKKLLEEIFPRHAAEEQEVYDERLKRAFYIPYLGQIVDFIVSNMTTDPLVVEAEKGDAFWSGLALDVSRPGGAKQSLNQFARDQITTALLLKRAWSLIDLPKRKADESAPATLAEEEARGLRDAFFVPLDPECVFDWEEDDAGEFLWVNVCYCERRRPSLSAKRSTVKETFTVYDATGWQRYVIVYDEKKPPKDTDEVPLVESGTHSFGRVPIRRMELPDGLWAGGKIESIAVEHFNKRNALAWGEYRSLFAFLAAELAPPDPRDPTSEDGGRAYQAIGPGRVWMGAAGDKIGYVQPDADPFRVAMESCRELRDEMHRALHAMAQSVDNSGAALQRAASSKALDHAITAIVMKAIGAIAREHVFELYELAAVGRGDAKIEADVADTLGLAMTGFDNYDELSLGALLDEAVNLESVPIPSPTFQQIHKFTLASRILGPKATEEELDQIKTELEAAITAESLLPPPPPTEITGDEGDEELPSKDAPAKSDSKSDSKADAKGGAKGAPKK